MVPDSIERCPRLVTETNLGQADFSSRMTLLDTSAECVDLFFRPSDRDFGRIR